MSRHERWTSGRRTFLKGAGAASLAGVAGLSGCLGSLGDDDSVRLILNPAEAHVEMEVQYAPFVEYLEAETGADIDITRTESYTETLAALRDDHGEIADTSPSAAVAGADVADVIGIRVAFGAAQYFSLITTTPDSGVDELADLEGEEVHMGSPLSVSGTLVPMLMLNNAGLDTGTAPDGDPVDFDVEYSDHFTAMEQLVQRDEVVASANGAFVTAPHVPQEQFDEMSQDFVEISAEYDGAGSRADDQELQLLSVSDPIPRAPLMSRSSWDDPIREDLEEAILEAPEEAFERDEADIAEELGIDPEILDKDEDELTEEEREDLAEIEDHEIWFTGVEPGSIDDYEPIQEVLDTLGLEFEDIS